MKEIFKKPAVDLTDLATGIVVLGIVVSIGVTIVVSMRDSRLTELSTYTTTNETLDFATGAGDKVLNNAWFKGISSVYNVSGNLLQSGNYSVSVDSYGHATVTNLTSTFPNTVNVTYDAYNTSRADWTVANNASIGLAEYGNWFKIIVIVGVAGLVLWLLFSAFGKNQGSNSVTY